MVEKPLRAIMTDRLLSGSKQGFALDLAADQQWSKFDP